MAEIKAILVQSGQMYPSVYELEIGGTKYPWRWVPLYSLHLHVNEMIMTEQKGEGTFAGLIGIIESFGQLMKPDAEYPLYTFAVDGTYYLNTASPPSLTNNITVDLYVPEGWSNCVMDLVRRGVRSVRRDEAQKKNRLTAILYDKKEVQIVSVGSESIIPWQTWIIVDEV